MQISSILLGKLAFEKRLDLIMKDDLRKGTQLLHLWRTQAGKCPKCGERITKEGGWNIHHILPKAQGGSDKSTNLVLLHPNCHRQVHSYGDSKLLAPTIWGFEEA